MGRARASGNHRRTAMPASPPNADTSKATPRPWYIAQQSATECLIYGGHSVNSFPRVYCNGHEGKKACHDAALIVEAANPYHPRPPPPGRPAPARPFDGPPPPREPQETPAAPGDAGGGAMKFILFMRDGNDH